MMLSNKINCLFGIHTFFHLAQCTSSPIATATNTYSTKVYNVYAATARLTYQYTNEELAMLWNQVGSIAVGPITTTVEPTPEPSAYPRPGSFHPLVWQYSTIKQDLSDACRYQLTIPRLTTKLYPMISSGVLQRVHIRLKEPRKTKVKDPQFGI